MTEETIFYIVFFGLLAYVTLFCAINEIGWDWTKERFCFNPKANYKKWSRLNWFGVWFFTILYWITFLPFTVVALIYWLFTIGRK